MAVNEKRQFLDAFRESLRANTFVKSTLGNYQGNEPDLQKVFVRSIETSKGERIELLFRYKTRDISKNFETAEGLDLIASFLEGDFFSGHLFTSTADFQLSRTKKGAFYLTESKPTAKKAKNKSHDRKKQRPIDSSRPYLHDLGITTADGVVKAGQQQKWRQINKFVETLGGLLDESGLDQSETIKIADMGCGKGYLTFTAFDYLINVRHLNVVMTGVDVNPKLVDTCNKVADKYGFEHLNFETGTIRDSDLQPVDILIALHACDTATDDALFKGIAANAGLIIASPCCHKEIRQQIKSPDVFADVLKHGTLLERQAELLTDGIRALILEENRFNTKVFEFVPTEHTPKNNLITAIRSKRAIDPERFRNQIDALKAQFGIESTHLERLLTQK